jgi:hypothetical protein
MFESSIITLEILLMETQIDYIMIDSMIIKCV